MPAPELRKRSSGHLLFDPAADRGRAHQPEEKPEHDQGEDGDHDGDLPVVERKAAKARRAGDAGLAPTTAIRCESDILPGHYRAARATLPGGSAEPHRNRYVGV